MGSVFYFIPFAFGIHHQIHSIWKKIIFMIIEVFLVSSKNTTHSMDQEERLSES